MRQLLGFMLVLALAGCSESALVERQEITSGGFNGLLIGMDKPAVLQSAGRLKATHMKPIACVPFRITQSNASSLPALEAIDGVRVVTDAGRFVDVYFSNRRVSKVLSSAESLAEVGIHVGDNLQSARRQLLKALREGNKVVVTPIISFAAGEYVSLATITGEETKSLYSYDCWKFEVQSVSPAGATYDVTFQQGLLRHISYHRPRVQVE